MRKKHCIIGLVCLFALALVAWLVFFRPDALPAPEISPALLQASDGLNRYQVTMKLDDENHTLSVSQTLSFKNRTGETLQSLMVRLWPNAFAEEGTSPAATEEMYPLCYPDGFSKGSVLLHDVKWNGSAAPWQYQDDAKTALSVTVPSMAPGEEGQLFIRCVVQLPQCAYRTGYYDGVYQLGHVLPLLAVYENGAWRQDAYAPIGEAFYTECANFTLSLSLPDGYVPVCSVPLQKGENGLWQGEGLAIRDIGLCLSKEYKQASAQTGNTTVYAYAADDEAANRALTYARQALETFSALYGPYPYPIYSVCSAPFPPGGMEYPCMAVVDESLFAPENTDTLELILAHETAHQWFYALVGSDPVNQPWQDEALCEYALLRYVQARYGEDAFRTLRYYRADAPMQERIPGGLTPASPVHYFSSLADYKSIVYGRGAALLLSLDLFTEGRMDAFLQAYVKDYSFLIASREDFENALYSFTGMDLSGLVKDYLDTKMLE